MGDNCDTINEILEEYMDDELDGDDKCFDVVATLKPVSVVETHVCKYLIY